MNNNVQTSAASSQNESAQWLGYAALTAGVGLLIAAAVLLLPLVRQGGAVNGAAWMSLSGVLSLAFAVVALIVGAWELHDRGSNMRKYTWIEGLGLLLVFIVALSIPLLVASPATNGESAAYVEIPIPAERLTGGIGALPGNQMVELVALVPNSAKTPIPRVFSGAEIRSFIGDSSGDGASGTVLIAIPSGDALQLQQAVLNPDAKLTYRLLLGTPTPTPTPIPPPVTTATDLPTANTVFVEIEADQVRPGVKSLQAGVPAVLVVVTEATRPTDDLATPSPRYVAERFCVKVAGFLDANGTRSNDYDEKVRRVLVEMPVGRLTEYARFSTDPKGVWLTNSSSCP